MRKACLWTEPSDRSQSVRVREPDGEISTYYPVDSPRNEIMKKLSTNEIITILRIDDTLEANGKERLSVQEILWLVDITGTRWLKTKPDELTKLAGYEVVKHIRPFGPTAEPVADSESENGSKL